jgi:hypothetical protein
LFGGISAFAIHELNAEHIPTIPPVTRKSQDLFPPFGGSSEGIYPVEKQKALELLDTVLHRYSRASASERLR